MGEKLVSLLLEFEKAFKASSWIDKVDYLRILANNDFDEENDESLTNVEILKNGVIEANDIYVKFGLEGLEEILNNANELDGIIKEGILFNINSRWKLREDSKIFSTFELAELEFLFEHVLRSIIIEREHRSSLKINRIMNNTFSKQFNYEHVRKSVNLFEFLVHVFNSDAHTINSFNKWLLEETNCTEEILASIVSKIRENREDLERSFIYKQLKNLSR